VRLAFGPKTMDIGTSAFNFMRTLMVAGTGGAEINECFHAAERIKDNDPESWAREWTLAAERAHHAATVARAAGQAVTARGAYLRACTYYQCAMHAPPELEARLKLLTVSRECFQEAAKLSSPRIETLEIQFGDARLPAYFLRADTAEPGPRPTLLVLNGGDSTNEEMAHWIGFAATARGWNCLVLEGPGQWSALQRNPGLVLQHDYEAPVKAVIDHLVRRDDVDSDKIALFGPSLGSTLGARVAAFEPRICACVCDGLVVDVYEGWHAVWPLVLRKAPPRVFDVIFGLLEKLLPQLRGMASQFRWMLGVSKPHEFINAWKPFSVRELAPNITCPMLVLYGEAEAAQSNEKVGLSALRFISQLSGPVSVRIFGYDQGWAATHCQVGGLAAMHAVIFDWLEKALDHPERLPRRDIGENFGPIFGRYVQTREAKQEIAAILKDMQGG